MSLIRQLWLVIALLLVLTYGASLLIGISSSRHYMQQELEIKNSDNANALALTMSQLDKDPATLELLLSAQFDTGFYRFIELRDPAGEVIVERNAASPDGSAPEWFIELVNFTPPPGEAVVQDGWRQFATLRLQSQQRYAWDALWNAALNLTGWFALAAAVSLALMAVIVRFIKRPLQAVIGQARAIGQRRFPVIAEPRVRELREVAHEMNRLSQSLHKMFERDSASIERLRYRLQHDSLTGALNRDSFMDRLDARLHSDDSEASGALVMVRLSNIRELNAVLGFAATDAIIVGLVDVLGVLVQRYDGVIGRLNGGDLALLLPGLDHSEPLADELTQKLDRLVTSQQHSPSPSVASAICRYHREDDRRSLLARLDSALARAEYSPENNQPALCSSDTAPLFSTREQWHQALEEAFASGFMLAAYPVRDGTGELLHHEMPSRLRLNGEWQSAAIFMPWVRRLELDTHLDMAGIDHALERLAQGSDAVSVNLSTASISDARFVQQLRERLIARIGLAPRLWLEVPERVLQDAGESFRAFCKALQPLGCPLGLEHVSHSFGQIAELNDLGMTFIKLDASLVRSAVRDGEHRAVLQGVVTLCHTLGIIMIAEGVTSSEESEWLFEMGLDGVTGPGVS
ncbi:bifunctional diguanylate cyclase/phosphodiesterase [Kushneria aurantia]|uniref:EAL domain-containing protein n=1 Tax=Kushneria aurantia TaxID=504092 RepID=A0ABV6G706_9GAMM|nr:EAL domain-containing protein [Kushneria aurantia]